MRTPSIFEGAKFFEMGEGAKDLGKTKFRGELGKEIFHSFRKVMNKSKEGLISEGIKIKKEENSINMDLALKQHYLIEDGYLEERKILEDKFLQFIKTNFKDANFFLRSVYDYEILKQEVKDGK